MHLLLTRVAKGLGFLGPTGIKKMGPGTIKLGMLGNPASDGFFKTGDLAIVREDKAIRCVECEKAIGRAFAIMTIFKLSSK